VITTAELHRVAEREGLRFDQAEKDYVILWLLSGLAHSGAKDHGWVFKGGTYLLSVCGSIIHRGKEFSVCMG